MKSIYNNTEGIPFDGNVYFSSVTNVARTETSKGTKTYINDSAVTKQLSLQWGNSLVLK